MEYQFRETWIKDSRFKESDSNTDGLREIWLFKNLVSKMNVSGVRHHGVMITTPALEMQILWRVFEETSVNPQRINEGRETERKLVNGAVKDVCKKKPVWEYSWLMGNDAAVAGDWVYNLCLIWWEYERCEMQGETWNVKGVNGLC